MGGVRKKSKRRSRGGSREVKKRTPPLRLEEGKNEGRSEGGEV